MTEENGPLGPDGSPDADAPRRAASARFDVARRDAEGMRDALDPATHSLGEALKLSYRILQVGIVALVLMFVFSGFQSVPEGDTGVKTLFGAIAGKDGEEQLSPGLQPFWPYPVGDLVRFPQRHTIRMDREFWPNPFARGRETARTMQEMLDTADPNAGIRPGSDSSLLTRDGDIVHMQLEAEFVVSDAVKFLEGTAPEKADSIVRAAIRRGAVETAAAMTLAEFTDTRDLVGPSVRENAQRVLDRLGMGLEITAVRALERTAPFAVVNRLREVQTARENSKAVVERARQDAVTMLTQVAGGEVYAELLAMIREYELKLESGDAAGAEATLARLGARMEGADIGGEVSRTVQRAKSVESSMRARLEREAKRVESLAASFAEPKAQVMRQLWINAVRDVYDNPQAEVFASSDLLGMINLRLRSSNEVMQLRRDGEIQRRKAAEAAKEAGQFYSPNSEQIMIDRPGRRLERDASGGFGKM